MAYSIYTSFTFFAVIPYARAEDGWADFTNNLATDLAPLLILFGEQVTKQFLSESLSIWDNVIFAMAPLGILTAVVSAIRVCGSSSLRAFIGRAQESPGDAERELLSCTSETTAEVWNDGGIARVFGKPQLLEVVRLEPTTADYDDPKHPDGEDSATAGIGFMRDDVGQKSWSPLHDVEETEHSLLGSPNLSLNIGIKRPSDQWFYGAAALGLGLQVGVLIYAGLTRHAFEARFLEDGQLPPSYALPLTVSGTTMVCLGMFLCALLVERSTKEIHYRKNPEGRKSDLYWVQPGGQKVGEQVFKAFIGRSSDSTYIKSHKRHQNNSRAWLVWPAVGISMFGFVLQFVGLRAMHPSVTLAQLGATLLMAIVRASLRTQRMGQEGNLLPERFQELIQGHELDWLAMRLESLQKINLVSCDEDDGSQRRFDGHCESVDGQSKHENTNSDFPSSSSNGESRSMARNLTDGPWRRVITARARLARLTGKVSGLGWDDLSVRETACHLCNALERVMELLYTGLDAPWWEWPLHAVISYDRTEEMGIGDQGTRRSPLDMEKYCIRLRRGPSSTWKANSAVLEAVVGILTWSMLSSQRTGDNATSQVNVENRRIIARSDGDSNLKQAEVEYKLWIQRRSESSQDSIATRQTERHEVQYSDRGRPKRYFGWSVLSTRTATSEVPASSPGQQIKVLCVPTQNSVRTMCAQDIFITFLLELLEKIKDIGGETKVRSRDSREGTFRLEHTRVEELVECFEGSRLGSRDDAYMCIIPALTRRRKLPLLNGNLAAVHNQVKSHTRDNEWAEAEQLLLWARTHFAAAAHQQLIAYLGDLYHEAMRHTDAKVKGLGFDGISKMLSERDQPQKARETALRYGWIALRIAAEVEDAETEQKLRQAGAREDVVNDYQMAEEYFRDGGSLCYWAQESDLTVLKYLIARNDCDVNETTSDGRTPLSIAAEQGDIAVVALLLDQDGIDEDKLDNESCSPLFYAVESGNEEVVLRLWNGNVRLINMTTASTGMTPLMLAADKGLTKAVEAFLTVRNIGLHIQAQDGGTALHFAVAKGHSTIVQLLLDRGANVNAKDHLGNTSLFEAAAGGYEAITRLLLKYGADMCGSEKSGWTPLHGAINEGHEGIVKLLLDNGARINLSNPTEIALTKAVNRGYDETLHVLLEHSQGIDPKDPLGKIIFLEAVTTGLTATVQLFLELGRHVDLQMLYGWTPVEYAARAGHKELVQLLLALSANANENQLKQYDYATYQWMMLDMAEDDSKEILQLLLAHSSNANENQLNQDDYESVKSMMLYVAALGGKEEIVQLLLDFGADVDKRADEKDTTALGVAVSRQHKAVVRLLLKHGADVNVTGEGHPMPLDAAVAIGDKELVQLLLEHGAKHGAGDNGIAHRSGSKDSNGDADANASEDSDGNDVNGREDTIGSVESDENEDADGREHANRSEDLDGNEDANGGEDTDGSAGLNGVKDLNCSDDS